MAFDAGLSRSRAWLRRLGYRLASGFRQWLIDFPQIFRNPKLTIIECAFGLAIHALTFLNLVYWIYFATGKRKWVTDVYVIGGFIITVACWAFANIGTAIAASYFSVCSLLVLLQIVFLTKVFGEPASNERLLLLFIINVAQIVTMFAIWYELPGDLDRWGGLFNALTVFGTLGYGKKSQHLVVGTQIITDFFLLALFVSHLVGRSGKS